MGVHYKTLCTKRAVLNLISRLFDLLRLIDPLIMFARILFQEVWMLGIDWEEELPNELLFQFQSWGKDIGVFTSWRLFQFFFPPWSSVSGMELYRRCF